MKAVFQSSKGDNSVLQFGELPKPTAGAGQLVVRVKACAANPIDVVNRSGGWIAHQFPLVLGYDVSGVVDSVAADVTDFKQGDEVWYSGSLSHNGGFAQFQAIDARIVSKKPSSVSHEQASSLPLTGLTAWEGLFQLMNIDPAAKQSNASQTILVVGASGGLGSAAVQLAKRHAGLTVIGTAGRDETTKWVKSLGADHVIDHKQELLPQIKALGFEGVNYVFCCNKPAAYIDAAVDVSLPFGRIVFALPVDKLPSNPLQAFTRALSIHTVYMNSREENNARPEVHGQILAQLAKLVDDGVLLPTLNQSFPFDKCADLLALVESGRTIGKATLVVEQ